MSIGSINFHGVKSVELREPEKLSSGAFARHICIETEDGLTDIIMFSDEKKDLMVEGKGR